MKAGRPTHYKNPKRVSGWLEGDIYQALEEIRWRERKSFNQIVNQALAEYAKAHAEGNDTFRLDTWQEDPEFQAVPTILADKDKWKNYLRNNCSKEDLTKIQLSANTILKEITFCKTGKYIHDYR